MKNLYFKIKSIAWFAVFAFLPLFISSCSQDDSSSSAATTVKFSLKSEYDSESSTKSAATSSAQEFTIPFDDEFTVKATMKDVSSSSSASVTKTTVADTSSISTGVYYKVLVYDGDTYVTGQTYQYGVDDAVDGGTELSGLQSGKTYTFLVYSINSTTSVPEPVDEDLLSTVKLSAVSGDLMYQTQLYSQ